MNGPLWLHHSAQISKFQPTVEKGHADRGGGVIKMNEQPDTSSLCCLIIIIIISMLT